MRGMTGYGVMEAEKEWGYARVEIRSLNSKYLDIHVKLPTSLWGIEAQIRELVAKILSRGRIEVKVIYMPRDGWRVKANLNEAAALEILGLLRKIGEFTNTPPTVDTLISTFPRVVEIDMHPEDLEKVWERIRPLVEEAGKQVLAMREKEGETVRAFLEERIDIIERLVREIDAISQGNTSQYMQEIKSKIRELLSGAQVEIPDERVAMEAAVAVTKMDISEETSRIRNHLRRIRELMERDEPVGKRIDFMAQEILREANTICSKSRDAKITELAVEIKIEAERIREQVQNIE